MNDYGRCPTCGERCHRIINTAPNNGGVNMIPTSFFHCGHCQKDISEAEVKEIQSDDYT